jgi:hypothetical protein
MPGTGTRLTELPDAELAAFLDLLKGSDSVELKLTIPDEAQRSAANSLDADPLDAQIRQVYFFDTPELTLNEAGVVARARRIQGRAHDSVVKLRPVEPDQLPSDLRNSNNLVVEVDAMPGGYVCSATLKSKVEGDRVREAAAGKLRLSKLFSKEQRAFFADHAPPGVELDDLSVLGPIFVLKVKFTPEEIDRKLVAEMWLYPDGTRILELSTKCRPSEAFQVAAESRVFLSKRGVDLTGEQQTKTKTALEFFARELRGS